MPFTILVVDHEPSIRQLTVRMLEQAGFASRELASAAAALKLLYRGGPADVVIVDIRMPEISGFALARAIWDARPQLPVLFISGYPDPARQISDTPLAFHDFLPKPFNSEQLAATVRRMLQPLQECGDD